MSSDTTILFAKILLVTTCFISSTIVLTLIYIAAVHIIRYFNLIRKAIGISYAIVRFLSGEFILKKIHNGGCSVVLRTLFSGTVLSLLVVVLHFIIYKQIENPLNIIKGNGWQFCGIYAAAYASFYTRFVSQWTYLSNLYNQIKESIQDKDLKDEEKNENSFVWMASFIEDAENLHMETKPLFAAVIITWLEKYPKVRENYIKYNAQTVMHKKDGSILLNQLQKRIKNDQIDPK